MAPLTSPAEKVTLLASRFTTAGYAHAFGGQVALAAHAGARALDRIDLHVFAEPREAEAVLARLAAVGVALERTEAKERIAVRGQAELAWDGTPLGLRFGTDGLHGLARPRVRRVPFAERWIYVLSAEDLLLASSLSAAGDGELSEIVAALGRELDAGYVRAAVSQLGVDPAATGLDRLLARITA
jgi:hypothetical protein